MLKIKKMAKINPDTERDSLYSNLDKVFKKIFRFEVSKNDIEQIISGADKVILRVLRLIYLKFEAYSNRLK